MNKLITVENLVPDIYLESRDFKVFLKLIDILKTCLEYDITNWISLYKPMQCPSEFLELLSDFVGYEYDTSLSVAESRIIIDNFVDILKNRGSSLGIKRFISVLLNARLASDINNSEYIEAVNQLSFLQVSYSADTGNIDIFFPKKIEYNESLLKYVRPIGSYLNLYTSDMLEPESDIAVHTTISLKEHKNFKPYVTKDINGKVIESDITYKVNQSLVNLSQIARERNVNT